MLSGIARKFIARFALRVPIVQAPTGSIAGTELCAAVTNAGAMGAMALTWTPPDEAFRRVQQVKAKSGGAFLVNFALTFPPAALDAVLEAGAPVVTFSWGDAAPYIARVKRAGAAVGVQVTNERGARCACAMGADFLICQGIEAGGHVQSNTSLADLLPRVAAAAGDTPVVAAGGIATGQGIADALKWGAAAASPGTRFVATQESLAHPDYKRKLLEAEAGATALTVCFEGEWPYAAHRVLRNETLEAWEAAGSPAIGQRPGEGEIVGKTANGEPIFRYGETAPRIGMSGDTAAMCLYAGTGVGEINDIPTAAELIARLWKE